MEYVVILVILLVFLRTGLTINIGGTHYDFDKNPDAKNRKKKSSFEKNYLESYLKAQPMKMSNF